MAEKKKMGRPTDNPKITCVSIRLTKEEEQKLAYCTKETGKSRAEVMRMGLEKVYSEINGK